MIKQEQIPVYSIFCCSLPASGHSIPLLKVASALRRKGHHIVYATSHYQVPNVKQKYPEFQYVALYDDVNKIDMSKLDTKGPPLHLFYDSWMPDLKRELTTRKPDLVLVDIFSIAAMKVAEEQKLKLAINCGMSLNSLVNFGLPNLNENVGFLGLTVIKPNIKTLFLHNHSVLMKEMGQMLTKHLCIVHSFIGLDKPINYPPNIKMIGLAVDEDPPQKLPEDLQKWLAMVKGRNLRIIYVTFGSALTATQQFVKYLYQGLKKTGMAVLWSLKANTLPEDDNELFFVRKWLPQKELLKLQEVKIVITHGGFGGVTEIIDAEKPILCMPVFGDQPSNSERIEQLGIGLILRKSPNPYGARKYDQIGYTHEDLVQKVNKLLADPNYEVRIRRLKKLGLKGGGIQKACEWVIYAIQDGYEHLVDKSLEKYVQRNPLNLVKCLFVGLLIGGLAYVGYRYGGGDSQTL